eukprot:TRINITY_DN10373_c0_g1_i1.p1 TRINITY_DN10373_c0_g1~~TRINITY_DN10373_c0_g1_i1.p1  ORF type:complete len:462 (+),score=43.34 TRINITY_DN10373_c0_g1_i1:150-1535(+)
MSDPMDVDGLADFLDFQALPEEVLIQIFSCFDVLDLSRTALVCSDWHRLSVDTSLWRRLAFVHFPKIFGWLSKGPEAFTQRPPYTWSPHTMSILASANNVIEQADWRRAYKERRAIESRWRSKTCRSSTLKGHRSTVFCVFPMNDRRLISAGDDASIRIWDLSTKTCEHVSESTHSHGILGMYYCPLTNKVLTGCYSGEVKIWEVNLERRTKVSQMTARELKDIMERRKVYYGDCIEKSDLVSRVLTSHAMPVLEQKHVMKEHNANVVGTHMMNGLGATAGHDSYINVFNIETGKQVVRLQGHNAPSSAVQFYDGGRRLVSGGHDFTIHVWNVERKSPEYTMRNAHHGWVWHVLYDEATHTLVSGSVDGTVRIWDTSSGKLSHILKHQREVSGMWVDWNRNLVLSASFSGDYYTHDLRTGKELGRLRVSGDRCTRVNCTYDQAFVGSFDGTISVFDYVNIN